jgi:hypothetical protein
MTDKKWDMNDIRWLQIGGWGSEPGKCRNVLAEVMGERYKQNQKWGGQDHDDKHNSHDWIAILVRHAGRAVMWPWDNTAFRKQMIRVAAVAVAAAEWCDRGLTREEADDE